MQLPYPYLGKRLHLYYHDLGKDVTGTGKTFCARNDDKYHSLVEICYYETLLIIEKS